MSPAPPPTPAAAEGPSLPPPGLPSPVAPKPLLDDWFGGFWPERGLPAKLSVLLGAAGVGVFGALVLPFRNLGLGTFLVLLAAGGVVLVASKRRDAYVLACAALCVLLAATSVVRAAEWIVILCLLAGAAVCVSAVTGARTIAGFVLAGVSWPLAGLRGLPWLGRTLGQVAGLGRRAALVRTVVLSVLGLVVFGALFASADALVAKWVDALVPDLTMDSAVLRVFIAVAVGGAVLAAAYVALNPPVVNQVSSAVRPVAARFEWLTPVLVVNAVFAVFLLAQVTVIFGGHDYLERTTGLTYAEYVHRGFGQLTVATALTLVVVWAATRRAPRETAADRAWLRGTLGLLCAQTLIVVASALHRMALYQEAYGFTQLRVLVDVFEAWLGLIVLAVVVGGIRLRAAWLPRFALLSGAVVLLGLAAANPDAWIAEQNLDRYAETGKVDWAYLSGLSADAVPVLADVPAGERACALDGREPADDDWLAWNLGRSRADAALEDTTVPAPTQACWMEPSSTERVTP